MPSHAAPESIKGRLLTCKAAYSGGTVPVLHRVSILSHKAPLTSLFNYHVLILALITNKVNNQQNNMKSFRPVLPMYFSMIIPMDLPSFFTG